MPAVRDIIEINEDLCTGCGLCVPGCAEGAITIVNGKAKVLAENLCDGLGACLGACPHGALKIIRREAAAFESEAVTRHLADQAGTEGARACLGEKDSRRSVCPGLQPLGALACGCPSNMAMSLPVEERAALAGNRHWPIKIRLAQPDAPFLQGADLLVAADCAAAVSPEIQGELRRGKILLLGCPKFEGADFLADRLAEIFQRAASCTVLRMEVPCCQGLVQACRVAVRTCGKSIPVREVTVSRTGESR